jgi:hypothetical protein
MQKKGIKYIQVKNVDKYFNKKILNKDTVNLITQYFPSKDKIRFKENLYCLHKNINNPYIDKIYLLNEKIYTNNDLYLDKIPEKVIQINIGKRLKFKDIFEFVNKNKVKGYIIFGNLDIFFNASLRNIFFTSLMKKKTVYCQLRYEFYKNVQKVRSLFRSNAQDIWIYHTNNNKLLKNTDEFNYYFGQPGCDTRTNFLFSKKGFKCYNHPSIINCIHVHKSLKRNYGLKTVLKTHMKITPIYYIK